MKIINLYKVETAEGHRVTSPQALLDGLISYLSIDPFAFAAKPEKEQKQILCDIIKLDLDKFEQEYAKLYSERSELNKHKKTLESSLANIAPPTASESTTIIKTKDTVDRLIKVRDKLNRMSDISHDISEAEDKLKELVAEYNQVSDTNSSVIINWSPEEDDIDKLYKEIERLEIELSNAESINKRVQEIENYNKLKQELDKIVIEAEQLSNALELIEIKKTEAIEKAKLPVDGLDITPDGITYNKIPWKQLSTAQKIKISMAIAMSTNPKVRVLRIKDGSLLDEENMSIITELAKQHDFQVWIECVDSSGKVGVFIEDGEVKRDNYDKPTME